MRVAAFLLLALFLPLGASAQSVTSGTAKAGVKSNKPAKGKHKAVVDSDVAEPAEIDSERMAVAPLVLQGEARCEFGHKVQLQAHPTLRGRFQLMYQGLMHTLTPHPTTTGVIRLENKHSGMVWLQVPVKSMLMDSKKGQRVADNCMHPAQVAEAQAAQGQSTGLQ